MKSIKLGLIGLIATTLAGCGTISYGISADCQIGGNCSVKGEIKGSIQIQSERDFIASILSSSNTWDAQSFEIDLSGSTVSYPQNGYATIYLKSSNGGTVAQQTFPWYQTSGKIRLSNPDAVNSWAISNSAGVSSVSYELNQAVATGTSESNPLNVSVRYDGVQRASASTSWSAPPKDCPRCFIQIQ